MLWFMNNFRLGKRDKFWLAVALSIVVILFFIRMMSHDGFSDSGKPVWKSAVLGSEPLKDSSKSNTFHTSSKHPIK